MKIGVIIQARMGSTRLPGKIMKIIQGKTVLNHVISRVKKSRIVDDIIIATTENDIDSKVEHEALRCGVKIYRGSEENVLSRYYYAAKENSIDIVVRITSDCPLIDPIILDDMLNCYLQNQYDIVSNAGADLSKRTFPRGLDIEIFSFRLLEEAHYKAVKQYHREHVTPYIYETSKKINYYMQQSDDSQHRWTLDTEEDFELISLIYENLYRGEHEFYLEHILDLFNKNPELFSINAHIEQKQVK